jgi:hypothetical protein
MIKEYLEAETGLEISELGIYPGATVKIRRDQYSLFEIKRMAEETKEINISPSFQRHNVWKPLQKSELIESILMNIPIPVIYVFENEVGLKQIVDGKQRINSIIDFMNNKFNLLNLKMLPQFNKKYFNDLEPLYRNKIERYQLFFYVIEPPTPERVKYDIFDRVNRGGTTLNSQEMRNALYQGKSTILFDELSQKNEFKKATGNAIDSTRMRDQYVILRFLSFYFLRKKIFSFNYQSNMEDFLAFSMNFINNLDNDRINEIKDVFVRAMAHSFEILGEDGFRFSNEKGKKRPVNMPLFEALSFLFANIDLNKYTEKKLLKNRIESLKDNFDMSGKFKGNIDSSVNVEYRFSEVEKVIEAINAKTNTY